MKKSNIIGWVGGVLIWIFLTALIPAPTCNDGWQSLSIGSRGACSWHHGVNYHGGWRLLALLASILGGVAIAGAYSGELQKEIKEYKEAREREAKGLPKKPVVIPPKKYTSSFNGYSKDTPKEVIIQLMVQSGDPGSLVKQASSKFNLSEDEAKVLAEEAKRLIEKNNHNQ